MKELWQAGFFEAFYNFSNLWVSLPIWLCVIIGFVLQFCFLTKYRKKNCKWLFPAVSAAAAAAGEIVSHILTGWEMVGWMLLYGFVLCLLLGILLAEIFFHVRKLYIRK